MFSEAVELFKADLERDTTIKKASKEYRLRCLAKIQTTWPELWKLRLDAITVEGCKDWSARVNKEIASHYFNNTIGTLKQVLQIGIKAHKANGGRALENPAIELKRVRVKQKELQLPESSHFKSRVASVSLRSAKKPHPSGISWVSCGRARETDEERKLPSQPQPAAAMAC
jgi:hypothetical protein